MRELSDGALLAEYTARQSEEAFAVLVERYIALVYSAALRQVRDPQTAQDVAQAVFLLLARKARTLGDRTVLSGWLCRTAHFVAANARKNEYRRLRREEMAANMDYTTDDAWTQLAPLLDEAVARLGDKDRNAIVLRFYEQKPLRDVGVALGVDENAAQKRVSRALEKLRGFFSKRGVALTTALIAGAVSANSIHAAPAGLAASIASSAAQGTAVTGSTLTLIKGALKLMAWSKAKTAVVVGAVALLATATTVVVVKTVHAARARGYPNIAGDWGGTLNVHGQTLRVIMKITGTNGAYQAKVNSIDQGMELQASALAYDYPSLQVQLASIGGAYSGKFSASEKELVGAWRQGGASLPLTLTRTETPVAPAELAPEDYAPRAGSDVQGFWQGTLNVGQASLRLNFKISEGADGALRVAIDSVDQGARNLPASGATYQSPTLKLEFAGIGGTFAGTVSGQQIKGTWTQLKHSWPLVLNRTNEDDAIAAQEMNYDHTGPDDLPGHWHGTLNAGGTKLRLALNIGTLPDGSLSSTMISPDQTTAEIPATKIDWTRPNVRIEWKALNGVFAGKVGGGKLSGTWSQNGATMPMVFSRGDP